MPGIWPPGTSRNKDGHSHRWCRAASSSEPPTSVGLACRPVGACRRHLVKRINYAGFNRFEALSGLNTPDTQQRAPKSRISSGISSPAMTGDNCDCGQLVGTGRQAMIPAHLVELLIDPLAAPDRHVAMLVGNGMSIGSRECSDHRRNCHHCIKRQLPAINVRNSPRSARGAVRACNRWRAAGRAGRPRRDRSPPRGAPVRRRRPQCHGHAGSPRPRCQPDWLWRSRSCRPRAPP